MGFELGEEMAWCGSSLEKDEIKMLLVHSPTVGGFQVET